MLLVRDEREWHQFERDLSFTGIVGFVRKTLKCVQGCVRACQGVYGCGVHVHAACVLCRWSEATVSTIFSNHASLLDALGADQSGEAHVVTCPSCRQPLCEMTWSLRSHSLSWCLLFAEASLYPPQLREDDEVGVFVHDHKITAKLFQHFDRDPNQLRESIAANPLSVVAFYQPCTSTGSRGTLAVAMATSFYVCRVRS